MFAENLCSEEARRLCAYTTRRSCADSTLDIRPVVGVILKQFTARDVISKWDVIEARHRATAYTAKEFTDTLCRRMPFPIKVKQVDGDSAFYAQFELVRNDKGIKLFVLPPKSPKLNRSVERANRTPTEEFYEVNECSWKIPELNRQLLGLEYIYNCIRPHHSLRKRTPLQFLKDNGIIQNYKPLSQPHMNLLAVWLSSDILILKYLLQGGEDGNRKESNVCRKD